MKQYKTTGLGSVGLSVIIGLFLLNSTVSCSEPGSHVIVDGEKLTRDDLLEERKKQYVQLYNKFQSDTFRLLQDLAVEKMLEKEAKANDQNMDEYIASVRAEAQVPGEEEVKAAHQFFKEQGYVKGSLKESRSRVVSMLMRQYEQQALSNELDRLKEKYGMETYLHEIKAPVERADVDVAGEPARGPKDAPITIVEFSDFECPFCKRAQATTEKIREKYGNKIRWVFKDFPLNFHQNAMGAHVAANCVYKQDENSYWKFFDVVFANAPGSLKARELAGHAKQVGVDMNQFQACIKDPAMEEEVQADISEGQKHGVNGTPAFFINGRLLEGAVPANQFEKIIEDELAK